MILSSYDKAILPKIWIERIPQYWERRVPDSSSYPKTTTSFDLKFEEEDKVAIKEMESKLNTEESIVTPELIGEGNRLSGYLGAYDVNGQVGEEILIFPEKVPDGTTDIIAFHYSDPSNEVIKSEDEVVDESEEDISTNDSENEEVSKEWVRIEDAHIVDGYVYGTLNSFSPIVVFTVGRSSYYKEAITVNNVYLGNTFVGNGCPFVVRTDENGNIIIKDSQGVEKEYNSVQTIVGGSIDGSDIENISVSFVNMENLNRRIIFRGSSIVPDNDTTVKVGTETIFIDGSNKELIIPRFAGARVKVDDLNITLKNSKFSYIGTGESMIGSIDTNGTDCSTVGLASPSRTKNVNWYLENVEVNNAFIGGWNARYYNQNVVCKAKNCNFTGWFTTGGSNGKSDNLVMEAEDCKFAIYQTTNRGIIESSHNKLKNCEIESLFVGAENDPTCTGIINKVYFNIIGGKVTIGRGFNNAKFMTKEDINKIVEKIKVTPSTELSYMSEDDKILDIYVSNREI